MEAAVDNEDAVTAKAATSIIVVGASAGGVPALSTFVADLPAGPPGGGIHRAARIG